MTKPTMKNVVWMLITGALAGWMLLPAQAQWQVPADPAARKDYVARLIATVQNSGAPQFERFAACRELSVLGDQSAVPALAALLGDEKMSHMARYGLEPNPDPAVDEALRAALGQVKGKLLTGVIDSIGFRRDPKAVGALAALLASPDAAAVAAAAASLGRIGTAEAAAALSKALEGAAGPNLAVIGDGCIRAADALCAAGQCEAAAGLHDRVRSSQAPRQVRMAALHGAILARGKAGIPLLIEQLKGEDWGMAAVALRVAYELSAPELTQALAAGLPQLPADRQPAVLLALGNRRDAAALPAVLAAAGSGPAVVRVAAVRAACQIGDPSCLPALIDLCAGADGEVAAAAQAGLAGFPGKEADAAIVKLIDSPDAQARLLAIDLAGQRRIGDAVPSLLKAAEDAGKQVSTASFKVLGEIGGGAEIPALAGLLTRSPSAAAENALSAVCARESESASSAAACVDALCSALAEAPVPVRQALLRILGSAGGPKALATVRAAARDAIPEIADTATRVLCEWPSAAAAAEQLALAKSSPNPTYQVLALRGYIRSIGDPALAADQRQAMSREAAALIQRDAETKLLLGALGNAGDAGSLALVMSYLANPATVEEASAAAVAIAERLVENDPAVAAEAMRSVLKSTKNEGTLPRARRVLSRAKPKPAGK